MFSARLQWVAASALARPGKWRRVWRKSGDLSAINSPPAALSVWTSLAAPDHASGEVLVVDESREQHACNMQQGQAENDVGDDLVHLFPILR